LFDPIPIGAISERVEGMTEEQNSITPGGAPRREVVVVTATGRRHGCPRREGGPCGGGLGGPGGRPAMASASISAKRKFCKFLRRKDDFIDYKARGHSFQFGSGAREDFASPLTGVFARGSSSCWSGHQAGAQLSLLPFAGSAAPHSSTARGCSGRAGSLRARAM